MVVPIDNPVTKPVVEPTDATKVLLLVQVPPGVVFVSVVEVLRQRLVLPLIGDGSASTCIRAVCMQPVPRL